MSVDPGEGFRLLEVGEQLRIGDQFRSVYGSWFDVHHARFNTQLCATNQPHRRKIEGPSGIEAIVCADIATRQRAGIAKYGTTLKDNPLSLKEWLQHAYEECLDQAMYLRRAIDEL